MNYVQEEYRLFTAYAEERRGTGSKGIKVEKLTKGAIATGVHQEDEEDDSNYYQDTLDSVELLDYIPEGKTIAEMEEEKIKGKQQEIFYLMNDM